MHIASDEMVITCHSDGAFGHLYDCTKFIVCANKQAFVFDCPKGEKFDRYLKVCVPEKQARCEN